MERTQIYLTEEEREDLAIISARTGRKMSALIREAVDEFIERHRGEGRLEALRSARGIWKDREDLPDFEALRREFDERGPATG
jgi:hypothetical protein